MLRSLLLDTQPFAPNSVPSSTTTMTVMMSSAVTENPMILTLCPLLLL